jgi:hypothetical protein
MPRDFGKIQRFYQFAGGLRASAACPLWDGAGEVCTGVTFFVAWNVGVSVKLRWSTCRRPVQAGSEASFPSRGLKRQKASSLPWLPCLAFQ